MIQQLIDKRQPCRHGAWLRGVMSCVVVLLCCWTGRSGRGDEWLLELQLAGKRLEGHALTWSHDEILLLARDGQLWRVPPADVRHYRKISDHFQCYSAAEMRNLLAAEFGKGSEVSTTNHYLVVHPAGSRELWTDRFEEIYLAFVHYFQIRGWEAREPQFPLVAVVFPTRAHFLEYARGHGENIGTEVVGYYSPISNRILMYDMGRENWNVNAHTIVHEAAHQIAFNTGIHHRYYQPPRWVCEGLGTLFEARGVWNPRQFRRQLDRVNPYFYHEFVEYLPRRPRGALLELIASDAQFDRDMKAAYAESWAFSFFLAETRPRQYIDYLRRTAQPVTQGEPDSERRLRDFVSVFGDNFPLLETHYLRFIAATKAE